MDLLFNELSLEGQFTAYVDFEERGGKTFVAMLCKLKEFQPECILLKKADAWNSKITPNDSLHSYITQAKTDMALRLKKVLVDVTRGPFWDSDTKQNHNSTYCFNTVNLAGTSIAEASERDCVIISFLHSTYSKAIQIKKNGCNVYLENLTEKAHLVEMLWKKREISWETYLLKYGFSKLDFSRIIEKFGIATIPQDDYDIWFGVFKKFDSCTWEVILSHRGLRYKQYNNSNVFKLGNQETYKFRIDGKRRCHGYREGDVFFVIAFESDHKLSDRG